MIPTLYEIPRGSELHYGGVAGLAIGEGWVIPSEIKILDSTVSVAAVTALLRDTHYKRNEDFIYLIAGVEKMQDIAFDKLLKTLEEPPLHACFILITENMYAVPETVRSRCRCVFTHTQVNLQVIAQPPLHKIISSLSKEKDIHAALDYLKKIQLTTSQKEALLAAHILSGYKFSSLAYWVSCGLNINSRI